MRVQDLAGVASLLPHVRWPSTIFLRVVANWSVIAMAQRTNSTSPASGSLGLEPRLPPPGITLRSTDYSYRLSAWELDCHASLTTAPPVRRHLRLSVGTRQVPLLTLLSGTQHAAESEPNALDLFLIRELL